jgi:hypothetical protein
MTTNDNGYVRTMHPYQRYGVRMNAEVYDVIRQFILNLLTKEEEITIEAFHEETHKQFNNLLGENTGWFVYHVKLDLEAKGLIIHQRSLKSKRRHVPPILRLRRNSTRRAVVSHMHR